MFTGIVVERGYVKRAKERKGLLELEIEAPDISKELKRGDSVAVNGACLTATSTTVNETPSSVTEPLATM